LRIETEIRARAARGVTGDTVGVARRDRSRPGSPDRRRGARPPLRAAADVHPQRSNQNAGDHHCNLATQGGKSLGAGQKEHLNFRAVTANRSATRIGYYRLLGLVGCFFPPSSRRSRTNIPGHLPGHPPPVQLPGDSGGPTGRRSPNTTKTGRANISSTPEAWGTGSPGPTTQWISRRSRGHPNYGNAISATPSMENETRHTPDRKTARGRRNPKGRGGRSYNPRTKPGGVLGARCTRSRTT